MTIEEAKQIDPELSSLSSKELKEATRILHDLAELALDSYFEKKRTNKNS